MYEERGKTLYTKENEEGKKKKNNLLKILLYFYRYNYTLTANNKKINYF